MSIQRYAIRDGVWAEDGVGGPYMAAVPEGEFVKHTDHVAEVERLRADLAAARAERDAHHGALATCADSHEEQRRELVKARAERDGLAEALRRCIGSLGVASSAAQDHPDVAFARAALAALPTPPEQEADDA